MSSQTDPLAGLYAEEEQSKQASQENDPLAGFYAEEQKGRPQEVRDVVGEELAKHDFDDENEFERAADLGTAEAMRGLFSGASFGLTEKIPGLKTGDNIAAEGGKAFGSVAPISGLFKVFGGPLAKIAAKSPVFKGALDALAGITSAGLAGATHEGVTHTVKEGELPTANQVMEHGWEWAALDGVLRLAGLAGSFAVGVVQAARKTKQPEWKVVNEVYNTLKEQGVDVATDKRAGAKAMSIIEDMGKPTAPKGEVRQVDRLRLENAKDSTDKLAKPILPQAKEEAININAMVESAEAQELQGRIDRIGRRTVDDAELGKGIQDSVNASKEAAKEQYKPFYTEVENEAKYIYTTPSKTAEKASEIATTLEELRTRPTGYPTVINSIETVLQDAGYVVQRSKNGAIESIIQEGEVSVDKLMKLGTRLNEIIDYDVLDHTVKKKLSPIARAVKSDVRTALGAYDENLLAAFELAEEAYGINAQKFGRESIQKLRGTQLVDKIPKQLESATALNDLRAVVSPKEMLNVERDLLEKMNKMSEKKAQDFYRQIKSGMSKQSQEVADQIIRQKKPINKQSITSRKERLAETIDSDLANAMETGQRPDKTLSLWQTERGQKLVKQSLETHPQKKELVEYLQKQTLQDMAESVVTKDGLLDPKKLKDIMDNKALRDNLRELGGPEAVTFFDNLAVKSTRLKNNTYDLITSKLGKGKNPTKKVTEFGELKELIDEASKGERGKGILKRMASKDYPMMSKINNALEQIGLQSKIAFNVFTLMKFGFVKAAAVPFAANMLKKLATSRKARDAFNKASKHYTDPLLFIAAMENLGNELQD